MTLLGSPIRERLPVAMLATRSKSIIVENRAGDASRELELGGGSNSRVKAGPLLTADLVLIVAL